MLLSILIIKDYHLSCSLIFELSSMLKLAPTNCAAKFGNNKIFYSTVQCLKSKLHSLIPWRFLQGISWEGVKYIQIHIFTISKYTKKVPHLYVNALCYSSQLAQVHWDDNWHKVEAQHIFHIVKFLRYPHNSIL